MGHLSVLRKEKTFMNDKKGWQKEGHACRKVYMQVRASVLMLVLALVLSAAFVSVKALAAEPAGRFILTAEAGGQLVIAPQYISYEKDQNIGQALADSGHSFIGLEQGQITEIDGKNGNFTRGDQNGSYDLAAPASGVTHFRFSENISGSKPNEGLLMLMTAMAEYLEKTQDVQSAAKEEYETAVKVFVGCSSEDAKAYARELNTAMQEYEGLLNGTKHTVSFTDGSKVYSSANYPGVTLSVKNPYSKSWTDEGDGKLELPTGTYDFCLEQDGLRVEGTITVTKDASITAKLPDKLWLKTDTFRLSGSYGVDTNEEHRFIDGEFALEAWNGRQLTVPVKDMFTGAVYVNAEYDTAVLGKVPDFTAVYTMTSTGKTMEKKLAFGSKTSGAYEVLKKGAQGNTVIYRLTNKADDGYTYSQDYTVEFTRIPTLTAIQVTAITESDQKGTDQAANVAFSGDVNEYTYKILDTTTAVVIAAKGLEDDYAITVNGQALSDMISVPVNTVDGEMKVEVAVSAGTYTNTYTLHIKPGEGKTLSFISDKTVTVEVVNSNGVIMPYTTLRETDQQNRYVYTLVPGENYHYIATKDVYYHIEDDFKLEDYADRIIRVNFGEMEDWLTELALGTVSGKKYKGTIPLDGAFSASDHEYQAVYPDTEHVAYLWVNVSDKADTKAEAIYSQLFNSDIYHQKEMKVVLTAGKTTGEKLNRFLMDENPVENLLTIRLTKESNGVTYYQEYLVEFKRELSLKDIAAKCDGVTATLVQEDKTLNFVPGVRTYDITVSMAAAALELNFTRYEENCCFGEESVGYRILVDGVDVTQEGQALIELDGTMNTQTVTVSVENDKAPEGTGIYTLNVLKSPPVEVTIETAPDSALFTVYEVMSGERLWPAEDGTFQLCEGYSYMYTLTEYGYVGRAGQLDVTRNEANELVVRDIAAGIETDHVVTESGEGGIVTVGWELDPAPENTAIQKDIPSSWPNFRGYDSNNAVTEAQIPTEAEEGTLYWANKLGEGYDADAVGSPIVVDGAIITYAGDQIFKIDTVTGKILAQATMDHKSSFSITPPAYAEGMVFIALSNGCVQAFNADTLESLWLYADDLGGQPNCPIYIKDGYLYTGFWNSETGDANFVCLTVTDEDPSQAKENKCLSWKRTAKGGYYWAGAYVNDGYVLVGTDDGTSRCNTASSALLLMDAKTGELLDSWDNLNGDIRSTVVFDEQTEGYYFTSKGGSFYGVCVSDDLKLTDKWEVKLQNHTEGIPMSTCSPVVYNGRAYVGVSGSAQFGSYSGHNITVVDLESHRIAYSVQTQGYPQTSGLLTTAYEAESGYVYVYYFDNMTPGKLRVLRDRPGMESADYLTDEKSDEGSYSTAYALFTPTGEQAQYAICSPIVDEYGTVYFKNDSAHLMAFGSAVESLEITQMPEKTSYLPGEKFDPSGMAVTAVYANGMTRDVTDYISYHEDALTEQDAVFTISFEHVMYHNRENGTAMDSGIATETPHVTIALTIAAGTAGDVNNDGTVDKKDAQLILDFEAGLTEKQLSLSVSDVNGDGCIDSNDAVLILQYIDGKITEFPAEAAE